MHESLFREEAINQLGNRHLGEVCQHTGQGFQVSVAALLAAIIVLAIFVGNAEYAKKHRVQGQLDESNTSVIQAAQFGRVSELVVKEGDIVNQGDRIGQLIYNHDGRTDARVEEIHAQLALVQNAIRSTALTRDEQRASLARALTQLAQEKALTRQDARLHLSKVEQLDRQVQRTESLKSKGYLSTTDWLALKTQLITARQQQNQTRKQWLSHQRQADQLEDKRQAIEANATSKLTELQLRVSQLKEQLTQLAGPPFFDLIALQAGVVSRVETSAGSTVRPGQVLLYLTDENLASTATLLVPPYAAGHLQVGRELALEIDAFPAESYGRIAARIEQVPAHTVQAADQSTYYPIRVSLQKPDGRVRLLPGMTLTTHLYAEKKTVAAWLIEPLLRLTAVLR